MRSNTEIDEILTKRIKALKKLLETIADQDAEEVENEVSTLEWVQKQLRKPAKRKEPLVIRFADFSKDKDEPAIDVEFYEDGKFDNTYDGVFSTTKAGSYRQAMINAVEHAIQKLGKRLEQLKSNR